MTDTLEIIKCPACGEDMYKVYIEKIEFYVLYIWLLHKIEKNVTLELSNKIISFLISRKIDTTSLIPKEDWRTR